MDTSSRMVLSILTIIFCYFLLLIPLLYITEPYGYAVRHLTALLIATLIGGFLWVIIKDVSQKFILQLILTAFSAGAIGFVLGFFGPIIFSPGANQGPLLGIFITGPISFILGIIGGGIYWKRKHTNAN